MDIRGINRAGFLNAMNRQINKRAKDPEVQAALSSRAKATGVSRIAIRAARMTAKEDRREDSWARNKGKATAKGDLPMKDGVAKQRIQASRSIHPTLR